MEKLRSLIIVPALVFIAVFSLASCSGGGASSGSSATFAGGSSGSATGGYASAPAPSDGGQYAQDYLSEASYSNDRGAEMESAIPAERKIIRNASLEIMAQDASALYSSIVEYGTGMGGYEYSYSIVNYETYSVIRAEFKIPPENLSGFVGFIGESGEIINSSMNTEDITESFYDAATRLDTKRKSLERYYEMLSKAAGVDEIVKIQRIIDGITEDIEALEGRLKVWNSQVGMATVSLYIRQDNDPIQIRKEISWNTLSIDDMGYLIKRGFYSVTNTMISILQWLVVVIVGYSPLWIILAAGVALWIVLRKRRNAEREAASQRKNE